MSRQLSDLSNDELRKLCDKGGVLACRWCSVCDKHYAHCQCKEPNWVLRCDGELGPMPGEPGGPRTLQDMLGEGL